jgi:putative phage-type endonuclease
VKIIEWPQGSPEWQRARAGLVTASRMCDVLAKIKTGEAAARRDYRVQLVGFINDEMRWGIEQEPFARAAYEVHAGVLVDKVGLVMHPRIDRAAASPDGIAGRGVVEIKCPKMATHLQYLFDGKAPAKYLPQMMWQLACTELDYADFVSFDPRLPADLQLFVVRVKRDDEAIKAMEAEVVKFLAEVDEMLERLRARRAA